LLKRGEWFLPGSGLFSWASVVDILSGFGLWSIDYIYLMNKENYILCIINIRYFKKTRCWWNVES
jgi:hypothetical protein